MNLCVAFSRFSILPRTTPLRNVWSILLMVVIPTFALQARTVIFNVSGAGTEQFQGTWPTAINDEGTVAGFYIDSNSVNHGFLRRMDGTVLKFDVAGEHLQGTNPVAINVEGAITGYYQDRQGIPHGFLRLPNGSITKFNAPGVCTKAPVNSACLGTVPAAINIFGTIVGYYGNASGVVRGFLRTAEGKFITFRAPGAGQTYGSAEGTTPTSVNDLGVITGTYQDSKQAQHGFVRLADGKFVTFDAPGASNTPFAGTQPVSVNEFGTITGIWIGPYGRSHGFVRTPDGKITSFEAPKAGKGLGKGSIGNGTFPATINLLGLVTGTVEDQKQVYHGFIRFPKGSFFVFEIPGSGHGGVQGTTPSAINTEGVVTGLYTDANYVHHGFLIGPE